MIRQFFGGILAALKNAMLPGSANTQSRTGAESSGEPDAEARLPVVRPAAAAQEKAATPPRFDAAPPRVPAIDPKLVANYWREGLNFLNFQALARNDSKQIKPLLQFPLDSIAAQAGISQQDSGPNSAKAEQEVNVVLCLWQTERDGQTSAKGLRHPLMSVPAMLIDQQWLAPRSNALPILNERYLTPDIGPGCFGLADKDAANGTMIAALAILLDDASAAPGWATWWQTCQNGFVRVLAIDALASPAEMAGLLGRQANELLKKPLTWILQAVVYPASGGGTQAVSAVYENLVQVMDGYPADTALFRTLCGSAHAQDIADAPAASMQLLTGHIDEHEQGKRALFPLDATQRNAVRAILTLQPGQIQAVNGPPGSGKTAMLRAVVASKWVTAALNNAACPIIVACGATNQSVTNVIEAFGNAPHPDASLPHAQRWLEHAPSYGAFLPSATYKGDAKNQAEIVKTVCLEKVEKPFNSGFLYRYHQRPDILHPARALDDEVCYLTRGRAALAKPELAGLEALIQAVWEKLHHTSSQAARFFRGDASQRQALGMAYLAQHGQMWSAKRVEIASALLQLQSGPEAQFDAAQQFMDLAWRADAFHWAARYWEGQFLLAQRTRLLSGHPRNVEAALRRLCMLTPCLVSTLHTVPQFAQIDRSVTAQDEQRSHVFGVFDLLVLDEAGQALPEMAGAAFALAKTAAVVGDLKQLAPISSNSPLAEIAVAYRAGASAALDAIIRTRRSIVAGSALGMARLVSRWREADDDGVMLRYHYRCKPSIIDYCNQLCYHGSLRPKTDEAAPFPEPALAWVNIDAEPKSLGGSHCNRDEADAIVAWIVERWPVWQGHAKTSGKAIYDIVAIVTPYRAQSDYLSQRLKDVFSAERSGRGPWPSDEEIKKVTIGTVHRLQGAERPIVCFSLVEGPAQAAGSFIDRDATLMNVALSRAKSSFIIFANPQRLFPPNSPMSGQVLLPVHQLGMHLCQRPEARLLYPERLVLIEAGGKLATMQAILGKSCALLATGGALHRLSLRDGVDIAAGFVPKPELEQQAGAALAKARSLLATVGELVFATDDDRMGEYIAWQAKRLLGDALTGKTLRRVRLGAITPAALAKAFAQHHDLDENPILAEAVREVVDCLIAQRFARLRDSRHGQVVADAAAPSASLAATLAALAQCGACTEALLGSIHSVGRVQGAILRILLNQARDTQNCANQYRIAATVTHQGLQYSGYVVNLKEQRDTTTPENARRFCAQSATPLGAAAQPAVLQETAKPPLPGTIDVLIAAWSKACMTPWDVMAALQALYEGSWQPRPSQPEPILEPIAEIDGASGHPPIRPLDRSASPAQLQSVMPAPIHAVYSIIWDYFLASESAAIGVRHGSFTYAINDKLALQFESVEIDGLDPALHYLLFEREARERYDKSQGLFDVWRELSTATPTYQPEPLLVWDMRPDKLLRLMADSHIGRPSTFARALQKLHDKALIAFPAGDGPLRLTPDGLATAMALETAEPELSAPDFSGTLTHMLADIARGIRGPREVLTELMPELMPDATAADFATLAPRIWNTLAELEAAMDKSAEPVTGGALVTRGDAATDCNTSAGLEP